MISYWLTLNSMLTKWREESKRSVAHEVARAEACAVTLTGNPNLCPSADLLDFKTTARMVRMLHRTWTDGMAC
jgi:hypothetical protein